MAQQMIAIPKEEWEEVQRLLFELNLIFTRQKGSRVFNHQTVLYSLRAQKALVDGTDLPPYPWQIKGAG